MNRREPYFIEDKYSMGLDHYYIPEHYRDTLDNILINHGTIVDRVEKLAYDITQDYNGQTIHILCVLKGRHCCSVWLFLCHGYSMCIER